MQTILLSHEEVAQRAEQLYESRIRQEIAPYYFMIGDRTLCMDAIALFFFHRQGDRTLCVMR